MFSPPNETATSPPPTVSPLRFFVIWLLLGAQSFGGGAVSLALIRRASVETYGWLTEAEFVRDWALVQLAPGINLLGLIVLIGRRWGGMQGIALALAGLLLPSAAVTVLMTALYAQAASQPLVQAALHGILPATVGLGLATAYQIARPLVRQSAREGRASLALSVALVATCALVAACWSRLPVFVILCGSGAIFALFRGLTFRDDDAKRDATKDGTAAA